MKRTIRHKNETTAHSFIRLAVLFGLTILFASLSVFALVNNSKESKRLYEVLIASDQAGGDVETALNDLRSYIYTHMNTTIGSETGIKPPIQLRETYNRLVAAEQERVRVNNEQLTPVAQAECERLNPNDFSGRNRVPCVAEYIEKNGTKAQPVLDSFYKFDFAAPRWSPDLAGFSILFAIISGLAFAIDFGLYLRTRHMVRSTR